MLKFDWHFLVNHATGSMFCDEEGNTFPLISEDVQLSRTTKIWAVIKFLASFAAIALFVPAIIMLAGKQYMGLICFITIIWIDLTAQFLCERSAKKDANRDTDISCAE